MLREIRPQRIGDRAIGTRDQKVLRFFKQPPGDSGHLVRRLALPENHFGQAVAQAAMMIQLRVAQVLERQVPHPLERRVHVHCARAHAFEQAAQLI